MAKLTYILLLIVAAIFYPLYENVLSLMILVTLLVLPVLLFADLIAKRQKIGFSAGESIVTGKGTHDAVFTVSCRNLLMFADPFHAGDQVTVFRRALKRKIL